jgi:hypothetical protein
MKRSLVLIIALLALCSGLSAQANADDPLKRALSGRQVLVKIDMPATELGTDVIVDKNEALVDTGKHRKLVTENGVAIANGTKARITGVQYLKNGLAIELDGGGSPSLDWVVAGLRLTEPVPISKSNRELDLERMLSTERDASVLNSIRNDLDYERQRRVSQDERNLQAFEEARRLRHRYISENRKNWGSRVNIMFRSKESIPLPELAKTVSKYIELLPREAANKP